MKILHINTNQSGGAALCAMRICKALSSEGIESKMLFAEGSSMPNGITGGIASPDKIFWNQNIFLRAIKKFFTLFNIWFVRVEKLKKQLKEANSANEFVQQPLSYFKNITTHPLLEWADIIHLHYVCDFIDYPTFFKNVNKPIVWTLHDKYPAIGVMHFVSEFRPIPEDLKNIDAYCKEIKKEGVAQAKDLNIVAISEMMIDICKRSDVIGNFPITLIHNGVDTSIFYPNNRIEARKYLGIKEDATIFIFSSFYMDDPNKGVDRAIAALEKIDNSNKTLICIGGLYENVHVKSNFPVIYAGLIKDAHIVSKYYSAANFLLLCSYEETFAQAPLEAMSCGTPVITTPCSGAQDLIRPFNGVICRGYDADAISEGIREGLSKQYNTKEIRQYILENYDYSIIAKKYNVLYNKIVSSSLKS